MKKATKAKSTKKTTKPAPSLKRRRKVPNADAFWAKVNPLIWAITEATDKMMDLLPAFKKLSIDERENLFQFMEVTASNVDATLGSFERYLPRPMEEEPGPAGDRSGLGMLLAALGIGGMVSRATRDPKTWPPGYPLPGKPPSPGDQPDPTWPDGLGEDDLNPPRFPPLPGGESGKGE